MSKTTNGYHYVGMCPVCKDTPINKKRKICKPCQREVDSKHFMAYRNDPIYYERGTSDLYDDNRSDD